MNVKKEIRKANIWKNIARYSSLALGILLFFFALFSGAEQYGGGIQGIIKNSPNTLPWLLFLLIVFIAWKWEVIGGIILIILGFTFLYVFNFPTVRLSSTISILALLIIILGSCYIVAWYLERDNSNNEIF